MTLSDFEKAILFDYEFERLITGLHLLRKKYQNLNI